MEEEINKLKEERDEYLNGWKRAKADFINYQKEEAKRLEEFLKFGQADLVRQLITVMDSFDLAIGALENETKVDKGIYMIRTQLEDVLKKQGLERMIISAGQPFDPNLHEAVAAVDSDQPEGNIVEEIERGYMLNGRVVRPARVKIAKHKT